MECHSLVLDNLREIKGMVICAVLQGQFFPLVAQITMVTVAGERGQSWMHVAHLSSLLGAVKMVWEVILFLILIKRVAFPFFFFITSFHQDSIGVKLVWMLLNVHSYLCIHLVMEL